MHLVSSEGVASAAQQTLFMPMMTRMPKARAKMLVVSLAPNAVPGAVLRQNGVPVYDVALSKRRFSMTAFGQLVKTMHAFRPDVIQAWGHTAAIVSAWLKKRCEWEVKVVLSISGTAPLGSKPGLIDRQKLKHAAKASKRADSIVYTSEAGASAHRRAGFPDGGHTVIPLGVDPTRFKPDFAARRKVREQLGLTNDAFVIGMMAPFQPEFDHPTLLKAVGELIKTNPNINVLLAGHGVQKGNAPLMALVGGGTLATHAHLLGEMSDVASFFNACDLACSSALTDSGRMSLVMAMLCGVPCVATGMGAQGEVIGQFGVAVEPGSPAALIRGVTRVMQMTPDKRVFMAQGARKHALANFVSIRSLQKYLQLYYDLVGRKLTAATAVPTPEIDATIPAPTAEEQAALKAVGKPKPNKTVDIYELRDPDSLESRDLPTPEERAAQRASEGDVLNMFESSMKQVASTSSMGERARGVADDHEDLLAPEILGQDSKPAAAAAAQAVAPVSTVDAMDAMDAVKTQSAQPSSVPAKPETQPIAFARDEPKSASPPSPVAKVESKPAPAKTDAVKDSSKIELSLADTMSVSMQISSTSMTGTLEIPPDLIFMTSPGMPAYKPSSPPPASPKVEAPRVEEPPQPWSTLSESSKAPSRAVPESTPVNAASVVAAPVVAEVAPKPVPAPAVDAANAPSVSTSVAADSSTVPALAVDALLSSTEATQLSMFDDAKESQQAKDALQLDLLGGPPSDRAVG
jgi:glycosyltransferase involved in cell wall biosynthesis